MTTFPLGWIVLLPLFGALFAGTIGRKLSKSTVGLFSTMAVFASFGTALIAFLQLMRSGAASTAANAASTFGVLINESPWVWISSGPLQIEFSLWMDPLVAVMVLLVTFVGGLIHIYSISYMEEDIGFARYFCYLNLFTASMLLLLLGKNLLVLFIGWEGVGLCSYLLIGFWYEDSTKASAGKKAFLVNRIGDFGFLLGIFAILACQYQARQTLTLDFQEMRAQGEIFANLISTATAGGSIQAWDWTWATLIGILLFIGATGKSAQLPLYVWLPDAMAGPTPVSALIHAATMVTAGVFMIARMGFLFAFTPETLALIGLIGGLTALVAAIIAIPQNDIKKVLAYSTVSQLGLMFVAMGTGAFWVGIFHVLTHAFFKACLFLGSGSVIHAMGGEQDIRRMGGLRKYMKHTFLTFTIATFAISGFPFLAGFFSKDEILWKAFSTTNPVFPTLQYFIYFLAALASLLTAFYMTRLWVRTFLGNCRASTETKHHLHESPSLMTVPLWILAILAIVGGYIAVPKLLASPFVGKEHAESVNQLKGFLTPSLYHADQRLALSGMGDHAAHSVEPGHEGDAIEEDHTAAEAGLMALSIGIALLGFFAAFFLYRKGTLPRFIPDILYRIVTGNLLNKFYQNLVAILRGFSFVLWNVVDEFLIDSVLVRGGPRLIKGSSMLLRKLQSGNVQRYAVWLAIGSALILYLVLS